MKSHVDLLVETKAYYEKNPRSFRGDKCVYHDDNGNGCAVGRILPKAVGIELDKKGGEMGVCVSHAIEIALDHSRTKNERSVFDLSKRINPFTKKTRTRLLKMKKDYSVSFLTELQAFHDNSVNWEVPSSPKRSLTENGLHVYNSLLADAKTLDKKEVV